MGFGPKASDPESGAQAAVDIINMLYPERSTPRSQEVLRSLALVILKAKAALSFDNMARFLSDPDWREDLLRRAGDQSPNWIDWHGRVILAQELDPDFAWLLNDRLKTLHEDT
ncbi:MAG: hypothetical protein ACYCT0_01200 [Sulfobacillus sp.]